MREGRRATLALAFLFALVACRRTPKPPASFALYAKPLAVDADDVAHALGTAQLGVATATPTADWATFRLLVP